MNGNPEGDAPRRPVVVVTGGEGALGAALGAALENAGWEARCPGRTGLDVGNADSVNAYFARLDRCDGLINNAGITRDAFLARQEEENWDAVLSTNLAGAMRCSQAALRLMGRRGGHIIHVGSYSGMRGAIGQTAYAASKAGLVGLSASIAREYGSRGVRSNVVLPGWIDSKMTRRVPEKVRAITKAAHTLDQLATARESAEFIAFLLGTRVISGQVFQLDSRPAPFG